MGIRRWLLKITVAVLPLTAGAQFDTQRTQYMHSTTAYNAGAVAINKLCNVTGVYRMQWMGFSDAPRDVVVMADVPLSISGTSHGVGLAFLDQTIGLFENQTFELQYAYHMKLWNGTLGLGLTLGLNNQSFEQDNADVTGNSGGLVSGDDYHQEADPMLPTDEQNGMAFTAGFGAYYTDDKLYAGLSVLNLNEPKYDFGQTESVSLARVLYATCGYDFPAMEDNLHVKPSVLFGTDFKSSVLNFTCLGEFKKRFSGGLGYRWGDSIDFLIGANLLNGLYAGYAYDLPVSGMIKSGGSHEICLRYSFKPEFSKKNKYKSERIL